MVYKYVTIALVLVGLLVPITTFSARATIGSQEFCNDNPDHFACDNKNDNDENDNEISDQHECENPPSAASCNNDEDAHGVSSSTSKFDEPTGCYKAGYKDGQNEPFDTEIYHDNCEGKGKYYDGFIDGCMDTGNTKEVCENATDK